MQRVGHLKPVSLPGGDAAVRFPSRVALAHLFAAGVDPNGTAAAQSTDLRLVQQMLRTGSHCTPTTSMGRLFDAVASLLDVRQAVDYEAQAAIELEALAVGAADPWTAQVEWDGDDLVIDPAGWIRAAVDSHRRLVPVAWAARAFHAGVAQAVVVAACAVRDREGVGTVGLTGGVFANAVLTRDCVAGLTAAGFKVLVHRIVPPNDGGLALGQVMVAGAGS